MANIFRQPLVFIDGVGVTISTNNTPLRAVTRELTTISIGNNVSKTGNPIFLSLTSSNEQFQINQYLIKPNALTGSINLLGDTTVRNNLIVGGDLTIKETTTVEKIESSLSQSYTIFESGSTQFGNTSDDTHFITGSFLSSGSISLSNYNVTDVSDDIYLSVGRTDYLITENGVKDYVDENDNDNLEIYLRKCFAHTGSFVDSDTFTFSAVTASSPSPTITSTRVDDFMFFVNGQLMESDALTIQQQGSTLKLDINSDNIGYDLTNDDEIVGWGKFNS
tara:strand:+ start:2352 stop:3185 length:834 start_codon:yes stop_codon:yes gene_type:complete